MLFDKKEEKDNLPEEVTEITVKENTELKAPKKVGIYFNERQVYTRGFETSPAQDIVRNAFVEIAKMNFDDEHNDKTTVSENAYIVIENEVSLVSSTCANMCAVLYNDIKNEVIKKFIGGDDTDLCAFHPASANIVNASKSIQELFCECLQNNAYDFVYIQNRIFTIMNVLGSNTYGDIQNKVYSYFCMLDDPNAARLVSTLIDSHFSRFMLMLTEESVRFSEKFLTCMNVLPKLNK